MRAIIYARTSKEDQSEYSLDRQVEQGKKYCELREWEIVGIYTEEHSAHKGIRPVWQSLFKEHWNDWDVLVVLRLDRGWRKLRDMLNDIERIKETGRHFAATEQSIDTTAAGIGSVYAVLLIAVIGAVAEIESATISERSKLGHRSSKDKGFKTLRRLPRWFEITEAEGKRFAGPTEEAYLVLKRMADEGPSTAARSLKLSSTEPLYRLRRYVDEWKATGPWLLPSKRLSSAGAS